MNTGTRILLAALWLAPLVFAPFREYAMGHDTVNYALAIEDYDIRLHQPQPPGFPYWVLCLRAVALLGADPIFAQTLLAFLFSLAAAGLWFKLDPEAGQGSVFLLLFSPVAWLYAAAPANISVALAFSFAFLIFARRAWDGDARSALWAAVVAGVWSGFRTAGPTFLFPLILVCAWRARSLVRPVAAFVLLWLVWYIPLAGMTGGIAEFRGLWNEMARPLFAKTSIFYGAPLRAHALANLGVLINLFLLLAPLGIAAVLSDRRPQSRAIVEEKFWLFACLYAGPTLLFTLLIFGAKPGYLLHLLPLAALAVVSRIRLNQAAMTVSVAACLVLSFFPYERMLKLETAYGFTRATVRSLFLIEEAQRAIAAANPTGPASVLTGRREAPNVRTSRYHFPAAQWTDQPGGCITVSNPWQTVPGAKLLSSNAVYALWRAGCTPGQTPPMTPNPLPLQRGER